MAYLQELRKGKIDQPGQPNISKTPAANQQPRYIQRQNPSNHVPRYIQNNAKLTNHQDGHTEKFAKQTNENQQNIQLRTANKSEQHRIYRPKPIKQLPPNVALGLANPRQSLNHNSTLQQIDSISKSPIGQQDIHKVMSANHKPDTNTKPTPNRQQDATHKTLPSNYKTDNISKSAPTNGQHDQIHATMPSNQKRDNTSSSTNQPTVYIHKPNTMQRTVNQKYLTNQITDKLKPTNEQLKTKPTQSNKATSSKTEPNEMYIKRKQYEKTLKPKAKSDTLNSLQVARQYVYPIKESQTKHENRKVVQPSVIKITKGKTENNTSFEDKMAVRQYKNNLNFYGIIHKGKSTNTSHVKPQVLPIYHDKIPAQKSQFQPVVSEKPQNYNQRVTGKGESAQKPFVSDKQQNYDQKVGGVKGESTHRRQGTSSHYVGLPGSDIVRNRYKPFTAYVGELRPVDMGAVYTHNWKAVHDLCIRAKVP